MFSGPRLKSVIIADNMSCFAQECNFNGVDHATKQNQPQIAPRLK